MDDESLAIRNSDLGSSVDPALVGWLGALWGKSAKKAGGRTNLLLSHLLDTAAVAELIWDHYLAPSVRQMLEDVAGGPERGRKFFAWLCGIHDFGKATPAFQHMDDAGAAAVRRSGLDWDQHVVQRTRWRHDKAGGSLIRRFLADAGWAEQQINWVWPLVAGHHGAFPSLGEASEPRAARGKLRGRGREWDRARGALIHTFTDAVGFERLADVQPLRVPSRAAQLQLSGFVVMADWISSDQTRFGGVDSLEEVSMAAARERARAAWAGLELRGGWGRQAAPGAEAFRERFDDDPRPSQALVTDIVSRMERPGLVVVEAPMGEGKTKAALLAAEMLAARFGMDGVFVGMPTQATSDPMFTSVHGWLAELGDGLADQVALLHGKRMLNKTWRSLLAACGESPDERFRGVDEDEFGLEDPYRAGAAARGGQAGPERRAPAEWFLGAKRGLLSPFVVGTIDQLLFAATRTKHVMLRMAGLAGKVVILDEVHAADVYMSQFLKEGLWWLGQSGVPVVLLSATLPSGQRRDLLAAYLAGAGSREDFDVSALPEPNGYPSVTAGWMGEAGIGFIAESSRSWRADIEVGIEVLPEPMGRASTGAGAVFPGDAAVSALLEDRLVDGGCALVIRNTVVRAQDTFRVLRAWFGKDVRLLHGRLTAEHRADRTQACLDLLGPPMKGGPGRPRRLILVATQLAEQSFDVDADLLVIDLAPMDLLLQRIGRTHRHDGVIRPARVRDPQVVVTGFDPRDAAPPRILPASEGIYGRYLLVRTAALVLANDCRRWSIPGQVPDLVARVYEAERRVVPAVWAEDERRAFAAWRARQHARAEGAEPFLLSRPGEHTRPTLEGLHRGGLRSGLDEEQHRAMVRDGEPNLEVVLVHGGDRGFRTLHGRWLGVHGEASPDVLDDLLGGTVRLPAKLTSVAEEELSPLDGWRDHPWLRYSRALILDGSAGAVLGAYAIRYDDDLGLVVENQHVVRPGEDHPG